MSDTKLTMLHFLEVYQFTPGAAYRLLNDEVDAHTWDHVVVYPYEQGKP